MQFATLYRKELRSEQAVGLAAIALIVAWDLFLATRVAAWPNGLPLSLSFLPILFLPVAVLIAGFRIFTSEYRDKTASLWMAIPASGYYLLGSKALALLTYVLGAAVVSFIGSLLLLLQVTDLLANLPAYLRPAITTDGILCAIMFLLLDILLISSSFLAAAANRAVSRLGWLIGGASWMASMWAVAKFTPTFSRALTFIPDLPIYSLTGEIPATVQITRDAFPTEFLVVILLFGALYFMAAAALLRLRVEA